MGFCRRCGDIVTGPRCKCGGTPVGKQCGLSCDEMTNPVVRWNQGNNSKTEVSDRWSQTYINRDKSPERRSPSRGPPLSSAAVEPRARSISPTKRFPRPNPSASGYITQPLIPQVTAHITSTTSYRPASPLKYSSSTSEIPSSPTARAASGILPSPYTTELSKAYGSVLQPKESLSTHKCALCSAPFPPDATIYPDPNASAMSNRFLCRPCFTTNGGSKGDCPACRRPVLILKSEGGFVENSGRVWHKRCFRCDSCFKNIGNTPMVDLLGRPSCAECFDNCLKKSPGRDSAKNSPKRPYESPETIREKSYNLGGLRGGRKSREGSPAIEELEQRLGIVKSRESSPALEELSQRLSAVTNRTPTKDSPTRSPASLRTGYAGSREGSPFVERRGRGRSIVEIGDGSPFASRSPAHRPTYERQESPELVASPSQRVYDRFTSPERPVSAHYTGSPAPDNAVEEMKMRFLRHAASSSSLKSSSSMSPIRQSSPVVKSPTPQKVISRIPIPSSRHGSPHLRNSFSSSSLSSARTRDSYADTESSVPSTPDLTSDYSFSDSITESSAPSSPPAYHDDIFGSSPQRYTHDAMADDNDEGRDSLNTRTTPTPKSKARTLPSSGVISSPSPSKSCAKCGGALFTVRDGGKFVTVPDESNPTGASPKTYHADCFKCTVCLTKFREKEGQAVFVRATDGACHPECAPPEKIHIRSIQSSRTITTPKISTTPLSISKPTYKSSSSRYNEPPPTTAPATTSSFPRFGSAASCPGCHKSVSAMELGVVPGPQGTRWHAICLVCGGKDAAKRRREEGSQAGCGKRLDSAAKGDGEGGVWCRECLLLLPSDLRSSPQASPTRMTTPLAPSYTGTRSGPFGSGNAFNRVTPQYTGTTTIARQFTGLGGSDIALMRQLTGGSSSPTRQLAGSPTKQLGMMGSGRPRPKSVIGMRSAKSVDEGRGMYLVRQMTGVGE